MFARDIKEQLRQVGAVVYADHFVYESGRHGPVYVDKSVIFTYPSLISSLCDAIADRFTGRTVDVVVGPATGGIVMAQWVAHHLSLHDEHAVRAVYAEKTADKETGFFFRGSYGDIVRGKRVLVVEDIVTSGGSARKVADLVRAHGGNVDGIAVLVNRGGVTAADVGDPHIFHALIDLPLESWTEQDCPLCAKGVPVNTRLGKGARFLEARRQQQVTR